jgi:superfamily I DNA/RNA helicase
MGNYNVDVDDNIRRTYEVIQSDYIKFKHKNQLYDFTDLPQYLLDKLHEYEQKIEGIDALFVDEFQDVDPTQLELFNLTTAKKKMYIGDPNQSIYIFRGSIDKVFTSDQLEGFVTYNLIRNYRSKQEIINYATNAREISLQSLNEKDTIAFGDIESTSISSSIVCERGDGGSVYVINQIGRCVNPDNGKRLNDILVIKSLLADSSTQVLCRSNKEVKKLQSMGIENVSTVHQAKGLEYKNVILTDFDITNLEELNIAYVGMTRAKDKLCVIRFEILLYIICQEDITTTNKLF